MIVLVALAALAADPPALLPGDPAPPLGVSEWFVGGPVTPGTSGRATLVEFTATWCGPCEDALPTIAKLSHERAVDLDVVAIHIWEFEASSVQAHVERHPAEELPLHIGLAPEGPEYALAQWMTAAGTSGIPRLFLVDATGTIVWIGSVYQLPRVLDRALASDWDVAAARAAWTDVAMRELLRDKWVPQLVAGGGNFLPPREMVTALDNIDGMDPDARLGLADLRFEALAATDRRAAAAFAVEMAADTDRVFAATLNAVAWELIRDGAKVKVDLAVIRTLAQAVNERSQWSDPYALDTWAHVLWREGDREGAIAIEEKALTLDPDDSTREFVTKELERFKILETEALIPSGPSLGPTRARARARARSGVGRVAPARIERRRPEAPAAPLPGALPAVIAASDRARARARARARVEPRGREVLLWGPARVSTANPHGEDCCMEVALRGSCPGATTAGIMLLTRARQLGLPLHVTVIGDPDKSPKIEGPAALYAPVLASCGVGREYGQGALVIVPGPPGKPVFMTAVPHGVDGWFPVTRTGEGCHPATQAYVRLCNDPRVPARRVGKDIRRVMGVLGMSPEPAVLDVLFGAEVPPLTRLSLALRAGRALAGGRGEPVTRFTRGAPTDEDPLPPQFDGPSFLARAEAGEYQWITDGLSPALRDAAEEWATTALKLAREDGGRDLELLYRVAELASHLVQLPAHSILPPLGAGEDSVAVGIREALNAEEEGDAARELVQMFEFLGGRYVADAAHAFDVIDDPAPDPNDMIASWEWFCAQVRQGRKDADAIWPRLMDPLQ